MLAKDSVGFGTILGGHMRRISLSCNIPVILASVNIIRMRFLIHVLRVSLSLVLFSVVAHADDLTGDGCQPDRTNVLCWPP